MEEKAVIFRSFFSLPFPFQNFLLSSDERNCNNFLCKYKTPLEISDTDQSCLVGDFSNAILAAFAFLFGDLCSFTCKFWSMCILQS